VLTAGLVAVLAGAALAAMAGYEAWLANQSRAARAELAAVSARLKQAQDEVSRLARPAPGKGAALEAAIARTQADMKARELLLARLKGEGLGNTRGFSDYMAALARQRVDGVWITGLTVFDGGSEFSIRGGVSRPDILPEYIRRLNREEALRGRQIAEFRMQSREVELRDERAPAAAPGAQPQAAAKAAPRRWRFVEFAIGSSMRAAAGG
jgi:hypothetical protein